MASVSHLTSGRRPAAVAGAATTGFSSARRGHKSAAFTLVEIMIVVVIIGLLAALAIPTFNRVKMKSQAARMANDFRQFEAAFSRFSLENGAMPAASSAGTMPAGMNGYLPVSFTQASALSGNFEWTGTPDQNIVLSGTYATDEVMILVDKTLDDGDLNNGDFTKLSTATFSYHVH